MRSTRAALHFLRRTKGLSVRALIGHSLGGDVVLLTAAEGFSACAPAAVATSSAVPAAAAATDAAVASGAPSLVVNVSGRFDLSRGMPWLDPFTKTGAAMARDGRATLYGPVSAAVPVAPPRAFVVTRDSLKERLATDMDAAVGRIVRALTTAESAADARAVRLLTIHGTEDTRIPVDDALAFAAAFQKHSATALLSAAPNSAERKGAVTEGTPMHAVQLINGADHEFTAHTPELIRTVIAFLREHWDPPQVKSTAAGTTAKL